LVLILNIIVVKKNYFINHSQNEEIVESTGYNNIIYPLYENKSDEYYRLISNNIK